MSNTENIPMDNNVQALDIKGYRVLNEEEKHAINCLKNAEAKILHELKLCGHIEEISKRSLALAVTNIQTGFMWAIRAIARPNGE